MSHIETSQSTEHLVVGFRKNQVFTKRNFQRRIVVVKHFLFPWSFNKLTRALYFIKLCSKLYIRHSCFSLKELKTTIHMTVIGIIINHTCHHYCITASFPQLEDGVAISEMEYVFLLDCIKKGFYTLPSFACLTKVF